MNEKISFLSSAMLIIESFYPMSFIGMCSLSSTESIVQSERAIVCGGISPYRIYMIIVSL